MCASGARRKIRPLHGQKRLAPLAKRSTCSKSSEGLERQLPCLLRSVLQKNSSLGILMLSLLIPIQEVNKKVRTSSSLILEREFRRQASKGSAVMDQEKSRAVNGKKVCCKATLTKITLFGEIMAAKARVNKRKRA